MGSKTPKNDSFDADVPHERREPRPDFSKQPPPTKLPKSLQASLDDESIWESISDGTGGDSTDSNVRYAGYAARLRTIMLAGQRYVAYTSDIGESFRPVAHPYWVRGAYGVSWAYLIGDVGNEGYKAYLRNQRVLHPEKQASVGDEGQKKDLATSGDVKQSEKEEPQPGRVVPIEDYRSVMVQRALFQGIASMGLPAFTIHSIVRYSGQAMKSVKNARIRTWGPIGLGLAAVPALPYLFDHPVEQAIEWSFHKAFETVGGPDAVRGRPSSGNKELRIAENRAGAAKEKEL